MSDPPRDPGLQAERTRLAGTRTMLSTGAATLALLHLTAPSTPIGPVLLAAVALAASTGAAPLPRDATGVRLAAQSLTAVIIAACALATVVRG